MKTKINDYIGEILIFVNLTWWEVGGDNTGGPGVRFKLGGWDHKHKSRCLTSPGPLDLYGSSQILSWVRSELDTGLSIPSVKQVQI